MIEVIGAIAGVVIGASLALGDRSRGLFAYILGYALLASSIIWLIAIGASLAGTAMTLTLFVTFACTKAHVWRDLPSLRGSSFPYRAVMAVIHSRRLSAEDVRGRDNEFKSV